METTVGVGEEKRKGKGEVPVHLGFGFSSGSTPPQKLIRTEAFSYGCSSTSSGPTFIYDRSGGASEDLQPFKSPGIMAPGGAAALPLPRFSFTWAQWQELHRQALIYKHIMSSVPVPPHLFPPNPVVVGGGLNLRFGNSTDPEPGRCRRSDGKKWRCSRDAAPDQKYCERHMNRGRPRSRKPVELPNNKSTPKTSSKMGTKSSTAPAPAQGFPAGSSAFFPKTQLKQLPFQPMESTKEHRYMDWMKDDAREMASSTHQWERILRTNTAPVLHHYEDQLLNLNSYTNLHDQCCPFLNPDLSSIEKEDPIADHREPRSFIDAWKSTETPAATEDKFCSISNCGKLPLSTLTLSMASGIEEDADQMNRSQQPLSWTAPVSPLGGPLAEALQSSAATSPRNGRCYCPKDSPTRMASSPSGVLQKALVSLSDSSSSSSPTFAAAAAAVSRSEIALQWWSQSK